MAPHYAVPVPVPSTVQGTTTGGVDNDPGVQCALGSADPYEGSNTAPDKWYSITGTGNTITVSLCSAATLFDTQILVVCGPCNALNCVAGNDDAFANCAIAGSRSVATFCSQLGNTYYVVVDGWGAETALISFLLLTMAFRVRAARIARRLAVAAILK